jgi:hypothetical protein
MTRNGTAMAYRRPLIYETVNNINNADGIFYKITSIKYLRYTYK